MAEEPSRKYTIIKKKILNFPRTDSVRSNASAYPILQGGGSKVVRLIREGESGGNVNQSFLETSRTQGMYSNLKGAIGPVNQVYVRKI